MFCFVFDVSVVNLVNQMSSRPRGVLQHKVGHAPNWRDFPFDTHTVDFGLGLELPLVLSEVRPCFFRTIA